MVWQLTHQELEQVSQLTGGRRYEYFIKKVADEEQLWSLWKTKGWVHVSDEDRKLYYVLWPHEKYAGACATDEWEGTTPKAIDLDYFLKKWVPGLIQDDIGVTIFPTAGKPGIIIPVEQLADDIKRELENYE